MTFTEKKIEEFKERYGESSLFECFDNCEKSLVKFLTTALAEQKKEILKAVKKGRRKRMVA